MLLAEMKNSCIRAKLSMASHAMDSGINKETFLKIIAQAWEKLILHYQWNTLLPVLLIIKVHAPGL
jgi:hypothetical protein